VVEKPDAILEVYNQGPVKEPGGFYSVKDCLLSAFKEMDGKSPRRTFMKQGLSLGGMLLSCVASTGSHVFSAPPSARKTKSRVVITRDAKLRGPSKKIDENRLLQVLDQAMQSYCNRDTAREAWSAIVKPGQRVGLKVNGLAGKGISTHPILVEAIIERLQEAGIKKSHLVIWDRLNRDLERAGFRVTERGSTVRCIGNDVLGYDPSLRAYGTAGSLICRTLLEACDISINLPVLKDHGITGMTGALKNLFGAIHNPNKYHLNVGDPYIPDVWMLSPIREKVVLTICDSMTAQYNGGPSFMPQWTWPHNGILIARDPVALDHVGWKIIEDKRRLEGMATLRAESRHPTYIATAADSSHRLGTNDPESIELIASELS
jgi:uncharacterized protein (DUF362 family)